MEATIALSEGPRSLTSAADREPSYKNCSSVRSPYTLVDLKLSDPRKAKASAMSSSLNPPENERVSAGFKADWQTSVPPKPRDRNDKGKNFAATRPIWFALNPLQSDISKAGLPKLDNV
ncbi:hypothetical protein PoB_005052300 [Plakobranchus ocellatus]|uniref:Uncharacterized protein n=1 Tax=Plakobranchus ocellatus TaxID=259542 RepID=A0AAV4BXR3_9GAST|nr:hypothetical protein PoB_005052300 [Plakobranchus ocellatus]